MGEISRDVDRSSDRRDPEDLHSERNMYAPFWTRGVGFAVDWTVCFFIPSILSGLALQAVGATGGLTEWLWIAFLSGCVLFYFTLFTMHGQTLGMKAIGIRVMDPRTQQPPEIPKALARGFMALLLIGAWFVILMTGISDAQTADQTGMQRAINYGAILVFSLLVFGKLLMVVDPLRQTMQDKITGIVVLRQEQAPSDAQR